MSFIVIWGVMIWCFSEKSLDDCNIQTFSFKR